FGNGHCVAGKSELAHVEALGHQSPVAHEEQIAGTVDCAASRASHELPFLAIQVADIHRGGVLASGDGSIQEVAAVRKKPREVVEDFTGGFVQCCDLDRNTSSGGDAFEPTGKVAPE